MRMGYADAFKRLRKNWLKFKKKGKIRFRSHLEFTRSCLQRSSGKLREKLEEDFVLKEGST